MTLLTVKKFSPRKGMINYFEIQKIIQLRSHWYCLGNINFYYNWFGNLSDIKLIRRALKSDGSPHWYFLIAKMGRTKKKRRCNERLEIFLLFGLQTFQPLDHASNNVVAALPEFRLGHVNASLR